MKNALYFFCFLIISISCNQKKVKQQANSISDNIFHYAKNIYSQQGSNKVTVFFTWEGQRDSIIYTLVQKSKVKKLEINEIAVPISNVAAMSTTDIAMIDILGKIKTISGVTDPFRISNKFITEQVAKIQLKIWEQAWILIKNCWLR